MGKISSTEEITPWLTLFCQNPVEMCCLPVTQSQSERGKRGIREPSRALPSSGPVEHGPSARSPEDRLPAPRGCAVRLGLPTHQAPPDTPLNLHSCTLLNPLPAVLLEPQGGT